MEWDDVRYFLALARAKSVRAAGTALGVSHSTVARRVEALEARLSTRLFDRSRDGYELTDAGRQMLPRAEHIEQEVCALERGLLGQDERLAGAVTITCCDTFVADIVLSELASFVAEHPDVELSFTTSSRSFDLSKREADIAIRTLPRGAQPPEHLIGRRVAPVVIANYVSQAHAASLDPEREGSSPRWVSVASRPQQEAMVASGSYPVVPPWGGFSSLELILCAAKRGLGLVMLPTYIGDREPELRRLAKPDLRHMADLWLLTHADLRDNARVAATRGRIAAALKRHAGSFTGEPQSDPDAEKVSCV